MDFNEFKKIAGIAPDLGITELMDLLVVSQRSLYLYMENGIPLEAVEKLCTRLNVNIKVVRDEPGEFEKDFYSSIGKEVSAVLKKYVRKANEMARYMRIPEEEVQSVADGKCRDLSLILKVCIACHVDIMPMDGANKTKWRGDLDEFDREYWSATSHGRRGPDGELIIWDKNTPRI